MPIVKTQGEFARLATEVSRRPRDSRLVTLADFEWLTGQLRRVGSAGTNVRHLLEVWSRRRDVPCAIDFLAPPDARLELLDGPGSEAHATHVAFFHGDMCGLFWLKHGPPTDNGPHPTGHQHDISFFAQAWPDTHDRHSFVGVRWRQSEDVGFPIFLRELDPDRSTMHVN